MRFIIAIILLPVLFACSTHVNYAWKDARGTEREDATADLEECRVFAARQYRPGMPAGEPYQEQQDGDPVDDTNVAHGEWRPDRSPFPVTNVNSLPRHDVPVDYTGYPGELDYYPNYLDDILEKCMSDRGWSYEAVSDKK